VSSTNTGKTKKTNYLPQPTTIMVWVVMMVNKIKMCCSNVTIHLSFLQ